MKTFEKFLYVYFYVWLAHVGVAALTGIDFLVYLCLFYCLLILGLRWGIQQKYKFAGWASLIFLCVFLTSVFILPITAIGLYLLLKNRKEWLAWGDSPQPDLLEQN